MGRLLRRAVVAAHRQRASSALHLHANATCILCCRRWKRCWHRHVALCVVARLGEAWRVCRKLRHDLHCRPDACTIDLLFARHVQRLQVVLGLPVCIELSVMAHIAVNDVVLAATGRPWRRTRLGSWMRRTPVQSYHRACIVQTHAGHNILTVLLVAGCIPVGRPVGWPT